MQTYKNRAVYGTTVGDTKCLITAAYSLSVYSYIGVKPSYLQGIQATKKKEIVIYDCMNLPSFFDI